MATPVCRHCGAAIAVSDPVPRDAVCDGCGRDLRACVQCRHHDPAYHNACRETEADPVSDPERRNFCEYFVFSRVPWRAATGERATAARAKLAALFGDAGPLADDRAGEARRRLDALFRPPPPDPEDPSPTGGS